MKLQSVDPNIEQLVSPKSEEEANVQKTKLKVKKVKKAKKEIPAESIADVLKKPRTRSVSLTLSENGIADNHADQCNGNSERRVSEKKVKTPKVKKVTNSESPSKMKKDQVKDGVPPEHAEGRFANFPIRDKTIAKLKGKGINYLFPIQVQTFKKVLEGKDVIAKARTGTGKTLAFALPLVEKLETEASSSVVRGRPPRVLVMAPTRELVNQVANDFKSLSKMSIHAFYGGVGMREQGDAMRSGIDVLVGTPGRLLDWVNRGALDTSKLEHVVLDEVDQMLDMGFAEDVEQIISHSYTKEQGKSNPQTLFFSATLPSWVTKTAKKYMDVMPPVIDLVGNSVNQTATNVTHLAIRCANWRQKATDISKMIQFYSGDNGRAMVFCETKRDVDELALCKEIKQNKEKLHGDVKQATRETVLQNFRDGNIRVLVTTNVAARGLDIPEVDLVIQTCPPTDIDSYIHRSGRTGRAGKSGVSICMYTNRSEGDLIRVERFAKLSFKRVNVPSQDELVTRGMKELVSSIEQIDAELLKRFEETAKEMIEERGAVNTVAALIAVATGQTSLRNQSLINSQEGYTTYLYQTNATMKFKGYVYNVLRNRGGPEISNAISHLTLSKDTQSAVFDLADDEVKKHESKILFRGPQDSIVKATAPLPELQPHVPYQRSFDNPMPSRGRGRAMYGGFKRSFGGRGDDNSSPASTNKKIKFD